MTSVEGYDDGKGFGVKGGSGRKNGVGVHGGSDKGYGVEGRSDNKAGVIGGSTNGIGVEGVSTKESGVVGRSDAKGKAGVEGRSTPAVGVWGKSDSGAGVRGNCTSGPGVWGESTSETGVRGRSDDGFGVEGVSKSKAGVVGRSDDGFGVYATSTSGPGVFGESESGPAGRFEGNVDITENLNVNNVNVVGDVVLANGADCAEDFDVSEGERIEAGTVMVIDQGGSLYPSQRPYDKKVAGVVSGAGGFKPGLVLDRQESREDRVPVALVGKVECKADAQYGSIEIGDLLTTSPTSGHAMKADDPLKAFGAVIGKALRPLESGQQLIPILIALQ